VNWGTDEGRISIRPEPNTFEISTIEKTYTSVMTRGNQTRPSLLHLHQPRGPFLFQDPLSFEMMSGENLMNFRRPGNHCDYAVVDASKNEAIGERP
jgi:hypothetical protein